MELFVPGRICLFGEHSDWAGEYRRVNPEVERGRTLISGTNQGIHARVAPHPDALILSATTPEGERWGPYEIPMEPGALLEEARRGSFWSYIAGVAYQAHIHYQVRGLVIDNYRTGLPIKKGLSSSAAICVLAARAFNQLYGLKLTTRGEMELAYQGEVTTPSRCGRMDQGCAFGTRPVLMTFDGDLLHTEELWIGRDLHLVVVDLQAQKDTMKILARLNECYPEASNELERGVQELLGRVNRRIVLEAVAALEVGDSARLGQLMSEAQALFDRYAAPACPEELTAPVLHRVLNYGPLQPHIWGGKGVGSQGDGTAQFVARSRAGQRAIVDIVEAELGMPCLTLTLRATDPVADAPVPAQRPAGMPRALPAVRKAVIPAAGLGTRLFPATKATKKEFFPVVDRDGLAKPAILVLVEEVVAAGLEEVILVVQPQDLEAFRSLFQEPLPPELDEKLPPALQAYAQRILDLGRRVSFVAQGDQEGFGHAVYCARTAVGDEPFLLLLGDHLYRSHNELSCTQQLLAAYEQHGRSVLGLRRTAEDEVAHYGTVAGQWLDGSDLLALREIAEKPALDYARRHLRVPGLPEGQYLTVFGLYLLKPQIFDYLGAHIANGERQRGEFQLSTALQTLLEEDGSLGLLIHGHSYDIGLPDRYVRTLQQLSHA